MKDYIKSVSDKALSNALRVVLEITQQEQVYSKQNDPEYEQEETYQERNKLVQLLQSFFGPNNAQLRPGLINEVQAKWSKISKENDKIQKKIQKQKK